MSEHEPTAPSAVVQSAVANRPPHPTLLCALDAGARSDLPFLTLHGADGDADSRTVTLRELREGALGYARLLHAHGVRRGDRVLILLPTSVGFVEAMLGSMLAGAIPVPLAGSLTFGSVDRYLDNVRAIAESADAQVMLTSGRMHAALEALPALRDRFRHVLTPEALAGLASHALTLPSVDERDTAFIQYTSGTTGRPKGAVISHRALVSNAFAIAHGVGLDEHSVGFSWLPLFHDMGLIGVVLTAIAHPYPIHLMPPERFVIKPRRWLELMHSTGATLTAAPNFAYEMCMARGGAVDGLDLSRLQIALNGAEPVHAATLARFAEHYAPAGFSRNAFMPVYGLAEATLAVSFPRLTQRMRNLQVDRDRLETAGAVAASHAATARSLVSVGVPVAGTQIVIADECGDALPERTVGEVLVRSPSLMDGYFRDDEASDAAFASGALRTGDLGFVDDGLLYITGRKKDLIIKSGRNIHPYDVERVAEQVDGLRAGGTAAFAQPSSQTGTDDLVLAVETREQALDARKRIEKEVRGEVLAVLGVRVDRVLFCGIGGLPRTTSGKIRRKACVSLLDAQEAACAPS